MAKATKPKERPKIDLPEGYDNEEAFLHEMRLDFADDEMFDHENHNAGTEDLQFLVGDQWDAYVRDRRINARKPVLTINRLPAFIAQVVGSRIQNETTINVIPDTSGSKMVADVRKGLFRSIQKLSRAEVAYDNALLGAVAGGIGNFALNVDYENDEVWDQSLKIDPIMDHFSVVWDRNMQDKTGADAVRAYLLESMPYKTFNKLYPWATPANIISDRMPAELLHSNWYSKDDVRIVNYWRMRERERILAFMTDGSTHDITDEEEDGDKLANVQTGPDGEPMIRTVMRKYAQMYICSGADILEGPYELPIDRIPLFRVPGWEIKIGNTKHRWGIIRFMKDPQRLHNMWRSGIAEKIMQSPKNTWIAADTAVAGREHSWRTSHRSDDPLLIFNSESGQKPERVQPIQMEEALISQSEMTSQDMKDVSNIHEANLGMPSNEVSGRAIDARVKVSDTGTAIYSDNLAKAIEECGRVMNQLVPLVYDTPRIIAVLGDDAKPLMQAINGMTPDAVDITAGKYQVSVVNGPSYATKRQETAQSMEALAQAMPQVLGVAADLIVEAMDWPGADKIAQRIRLSMPVQLLTPDEITPQIAQKAQGDQQAQQAQQTAAAQKLMGDFQKTQSETAMNFARARNYGTQADAIPAKLQNESLTVASQLSSRELHDNLAAITVAHGSA